MAKEYSSDAYYNKYKEVALKTLRSKFHDQDTAIFMIKNLYEDIEINPEAKVIQNLHDDLKDNQESLKQMNLEMQKSEKTITELRKSIKDLEESKTLIEKEKIELQDRFKQINNKLEESETLKKRIQEINNLLKATEEENHHLKTLEEKNLTAERQLIDRLRCELEQVKKRNVCQVNEINVLEEEARNNLTAESYVKKLTYFQNMDQNVCNIKRKLLNGSSLGHKYKRFALFDNVLYIHRDSWKIFVPHDYVMQTIDHINSLLTCKIKFFNEIKKLSQNFFWKGMLKDLKMYFRCNKIKN